MGRTSVPSSTARRIDLVWDTRGELNGSHTLTAVARDTSGHTATSSPVAVTITNPGASPVGLASPTGSTRLSARSLVDSSGNNRTGTAIGSWGDGQFGGAAVIRRDIDRVDLPALGTFYRTGFTYEAWVRKQTAKNDSAIVGSWTSKVAAGR